MCVGVVRAGGLRGVEGEEKRSDSCTFDIDRARKSSGVDNWRGREGGDQDVYTCRDSVRILSTLSLSLSPPRVI